MYGSFLLKRINFNLKITQPATQIKKNKSPRIPEVKGPRVLPSSPPSKQKLCAFLRITTLHCQFNSIQVYFAFFTCIYIYIQGARHVGTSIILISNYNKLSHFFHFKTAKFLFYNVQVNNNIFGVGILSIF